VVNHKFLTVAKRTLLRPGIYLYQTNWGWISRWHCSPSWGCSAQHCVAPDTSRIFEHLYPNIIHKPWLRWQCRVPQQRQKSSTTDIQWRRLLRARGHVPPLLQMAGYGGGAPWVEQHNKKLTKLYWPLRKRSPKRLIVLLAPKKVESMHNLKKIPALILVVPTFASDWCPHFQIRSGITADLDGTRRRIDLYWMWWLCDVDVDFETAWSVDCPSLFEQRKGKPS